MDNNSYREKFNRMPWQLKMVLRIFALMLPVFFYTGWRLAVALGNLYPSLDIQWVRGLIGILLLLFNLFPLAVLMSRGNGSLGSFYLHRPRLEIRDFLFTFPFWMGLILLAEFLPYSLLLDGVRLFLSLPPFLQWLPQHLSLIQVILFTAMFIYVPFRVYRDSNLVKGKAYRLNFPGLPKELDDFTLTFMADLQIDRYTGNRKLTRIRKASRGLPGNLFLFGGDLVTGGDFFIDQAHQVLAMAAGGKQRIACLGDHDYWSDLGRITTGFRSNGWKLLDNEHVTVMHKKCHVLITGITQTYGSRINSEKLSRLLENAPPADFKIMLVHQPSDHIIAAAAAHNYHLLLAGHTHGGQIVLRPFGIPLNPARVEHRFYRGCYRYQNLQVVVTNGIGLSVVPLRYNARAEVVQITVKGR